MTRVLRAATSLRGASVAGRVATGWLIVVAFALAVTTVGSATSGQRPAAASAASFAGVAHHGTALDAAVTPLAASSATGHRPSTRLLPVAAQTARLALPALVVALWIALAPVRHRVQTVRATLPPLRGPPHRPSSR